MQALQFGRFGSPPEVVELVDLPEPTPPGAGEVVVAVEASPINPADLSLIAGSYGAQPQQLPMALGAEGVGIVQACGSGVTHLSAGDRVLLLGGRDNWRQRVRCRAERLFPLPNDVDTLQLAMLKVNPPTAWLLLKSIVALQAGDWVIQNAANSGVGASLIPLAKQLGLRTVNIVRRSSLALPLSAQGADVVLVDGDDLAARVATATGGAAPLLAIDAIGGQATQRLAECLADGGTVVNYGLLSGEPCMLGARETIFRDIRLRGFWLARWLAAAPPAEIRVVYEQLLMFLADGSIHVPVEATYPLQRYPEALAHALREGRSGKILFAMR